MTRTESHEDQSGGALELMHDVEREAAGVLWSLAQLEANRELIAESGGIPVLIGLLKTDNMGAQETAAAALCSMAASSQVCQMITGDGSMEALEAVLDRGTNQAKEKVVGVLNRLASDSASNQVSIAEAVVRVLAREACEGLEHAVQLSLDLSRDLAIRRIMAEAGVVPHLVRLVEEGSDAASDYAAVTLGLVSQLSADHRGEVTHELISARHRAVDPHKQLRAGRALSDMNADDSESHEDVGMAILLFRLHNRQE